MTWSNQSPPAVDVILHCVLQLENSMPSVIEIDRLCKIADGGAS